MLVHTAGVCAVLVTLMSQAWLVTVAWALALAGLALGSPKAPAAVAVLVTGGPAGIACVGV